MRKKTVRDIEVAGKKALVRVDFNVPLAEGLVVDDTRLRAALPTLRYLLDQGVGLILVSHLGRPKEPDPRYSLRPVAERLGELLGVSVTLSPEVMGEETRRLAAALGGGEVLLLENIRFHPGETENDPKLSQELASLADIYVNDAFGAAHRNHASVVGVARHLPAVAGFLVEAELEALSTLLEQPARPFLAILGGAKVSDKLGVISHLLEKLDILVIGGAMCFTFLRSQGSAVGNSFVEEDQIGSAGQIVARAERRGVELRLPSDVVAVPGTVGDVSADAPSEVFSATQIPAGWIGVDIGSRTAARYREAVREAKTIFWNGPMGVFEVEPFARGTLEVARAVAGSEATTVVGGGDTIAALRKEGLLDRITHVSTGGGASMSVLEGASLPGVEALLDR